MKIWRKEHEKYKGQGLYVYKGSVYCRTRTVISLLKLFNSFLFLFFIFIPVFGRWNEVTANDFFQVQIDCKYRKEWDPNSVQLYVVDSDSKSTSDVLYWEFLFPVSIYIISAEF